MYMYLMHNNYCQIQYTYYQEYIREGNLLTCMYSCYYVQVHCTLHTDRAWYPAHCIYPHPSYQYLFSYQPADSDIFEFM